MVKKIKSVLGHISLHGGSHSKSKLRQLGEIFWLGLRYRFSPVEYQTYRFYLKDKNMGYMLTYMSNYEVSRLLRPRTYDRRMLAILHNKLLFHRFYSATPISLPQFYGFYHPDSGFTKDTYPLCNLENFKEWLDRTKIDRFFIKPCGGKQGFGVMAIYGTQRKNGSYIFEDASGQTWTIEALIERLNYQAKESIYSGYILEEIVEQHAFFNQINNTSLNTCRLLSLKLPDNSLKIPFAIIRFGRKGSYVDNWSQGGVAYGIDIETGKLKTGGFNPQWGLDYLDNRHPDSMVRLEDSYIPYWEEAKSLVRKAASITPGVRSVGWDVAIAPDGPVLIEGNATWSPLAIQSLNEGLLSPANQENILQLNPYIR